METRATAVSAKQHSKESATTVETDTGQGQAGRTTRHRSGTRQHTRPLLLEYLLQVRPVPDSSTTQTWAGLGQVNIGGHHLLAGSS